MVCRIKSYNVYFLIVWFCSMFAVNPKSECEVGAPPVKKNTGLQPYFFTKDKALPTYVYNNEQERRIVLFGGVKYCVANSYPGNKIETRLRASHEQFTLLLEFMEKHGDLSKPQPGHQGRLRCERLWQELADLLNSVGGSGGVNKAPDKWKRVWSDWKTKTKKKACVINREVHGPSVGPSKAKPLNRLEERVLHIIGITSITEHQAAEEAEFEVASHLQLTYSENAPSPSQDELNTRSSSRAPEYILPVTTPTKK